MNNKNEPSWGELLKNLRYLHLGVIMAASITMCALGGHWIDGKLGTGTALMIVGVVFGVVAGCFYCYRMLMKEFQDSDSDKTEKP